MVACSRPGLLLPVPVGHHRLPPGLLRDHRRLHRLQAQGHRRIRFPGHP
jgi:hypothetical protein